MAGAADVGILRRLVGVQHHRALDGLVKRLAVDDVGVLTQRRKEGAGEHRMAALGEVVRPLLAARAEA